MIKKTHLASTPAPDILEDNNNTDILQVENILNVSNANIIEHLQEKSLLDKTDFAAWLIVEGGSLFFTRPQGFGKTLLLDTIEKLASGDKYKEYFSNTKVCTQYLKNSDGEFVTKRGIFTTVPEKYNWPKYPIMRFNFREILEETLDGTLINYLKVLFKIVEKYALESKCIFVKRNIESIHKNNYLNTDSHIITDETELIEKATACNSLFSSIIDALTELGNGYKKRIIVLIDDCDAIYQCGFAQKYRNIEKEKRKQKEIYTSPFTSFITWFYSTFKSSCNHIHLKFTTGVTRLEIYDRNNPLLDTNDISSYDRYITLAGYTEEEIRNSFSDALFINLYKGNLKSNTPKRNTNTKDIDNCFLKATPPIKDSYTPKEIATIKDCVMERLAFWYGGYKFTDTKNMIFNPMSVNMAFKHRTYDTYWTWDLDDCFKENIIRKNVDLFKKFIIIREISDVTSYIMRAAAYNEYGENDKSIALMYQTGILAIKRRKVIPDSGCTYTLHFPNHETRQCYKSSIKNIMGEEYENDSFRLTETCHSTFIDGNWKDFCVVAFQLIKEAPGEDYDCSSVWCFRETFLSIMLKSEIQITRVFYDFPNPGLGGLYKTDTKRFLFRFNASTSLHGPGTKLKGLQDIYYECSSYKAQKQVEETVLIYINSLTQLEPDNMEPISPDELDGEYLTPNANINVNNIGQFMVMALDSNWSLKYIMEMIPNGTDNPVVNYIEANIDDWEMKEN